jgi:hypothetical protein
MSDNEGTKAKSGWTDKERLTYLFALIENSNVKFDYNVCRILQAYSFHSQSYRPLPAPPAALSSPASA